MCTLARPVSCGTGRQAVQLRPVVSREDTGFQNWTASINMCLGSLMSCWDGWELWAKSLEKLLVFMGFPVRGS
jgi:hypothetical protein